MTIAQALELGIQNHRAGKFADAASIYQQILGIVPDHPVALHFLGLIAQQNGKLDEAELLICRSLASNPGSAGAYSDLGNILKDQGKVLQAIAAQRRAIELEPGYAIAHHNLGDILTDQGEYNEAIASYTRALELSPDQCETYNNLGNLFKKRGQLEEAMNWYLRAVERNPGYASAYNNLGVVLNDLGNLPEAEHNFRRSIQLQPGYVAAYINLGQTLSRQGQEDAALACFHEVLNLKPDDLVDCLMSIGNVFMKQRRLDEALSYFQQALKAKPGHPDALNNLGHVQTLQGEISEALKTFRAGVDQVPDSSSLQSNLLFTQLFSEEVSPAEILESHRAWARGHTDSLAPVDLSYPNVRQRNRRVRVGYVSADFHSHPVGRFLLPLLAHHSHQEFEIVCYSSVHNPDDFTRRCRKHSDVWREVRLLSDEQLAEQIRADQIDILVDLSMHTGSNRLRVFARKPAPIQVTYLAYCGTTGLSTMDYRLTDPYLDPPDQDRPFYTEESIWLPENYWCYEPPYHALEAKQVLAREADTVRFGSLNNFSKVGPQVVSTWCKILQAVPGSTLLLHTHQGSHRNRVYRALAEHGLSGDRVEFIEFLAGVEYFELYNSFDIALDPFPYGGGTTTCDALWMGVPVVSLAGTAGISRGGFSLLANVGLQNLVAFDRDAYVQIAVNLANDRPGLQELRRTLRARMQASPLMNAPRFAMNVEQAYRTMWQSWCDSR